ncbi:hypothetical protein BY454_12942 [Marinobacter persicus]|uniref:Uncharacterized protein n=1 Tax=Marinobacter persicus TaxID=930118 RepID=A0A2S6G7D3_9GAMM|nr:hypothetical protein BY455_108142 [Marinobacter persicus]PPK55078.1 hypothetical protein B0H24_1008142 [Marinobacter persicus]PPK56912.1 hypothetical protein BY454_12942 [Marinobacter persicus]
MDATFLKSIGVQNPDESVDLSQPHLGKIYLVEAAKCQLLSPRRHSMRCLYRLFCFINGLVRLYGSAKKPHFRQVPRNDWTDNAFTFGNHL